LEKAQKDLDLQRIRRKVEAKYVEESKEGVVTRDPRRMSSMERDTLFSLCRGSQRKRWTVEILCGESMKSRESLDLTEEKGSYNEFFERF
jgi:hypothetical protein